MGIKDLWSVLTPYADRKPISELRGKKVAIDLAGWVCESLNVVDHFIHPKHHLKNLFFRTCYLLWEDVVPVFVLDGIAPIAKTQVMAKRNDRIFRGVKPREEKTYGSNGNAGNGRTHFSRTLEQCKSLLQFLGIHCVQAPGEAEAYCAQLNKRGLVDGVISQDSDCFAYGALCVYRNFSISMQGKVAAQGGAIDIYDAEHIYKQVGFGQHKCIVMGLLCGCDYCPEGVGGAGKEGVLNLFRKYDDQQILDRIRSWRNKTDYYNSMEMRVNDKTICNNCGHKGRTQWHSKKGCDICRTKQGCDVTLWRDERDSIKAELLLRKKALVNESFPNEEIIAEFLTEPTEMPNLKLYWRQPNVVKFIQRFGQLMQWPEIYCFQKFLPILTRWQLRNHNECNQFVVEPRRILKKRTVRGVPSLEIMWYDKSRSILQVVPEEQLSNFEQETSKTREELWVTVEPLSLVERAYYEMVESFIESNAPKKAKKLGDAKCSKKRSKKTKALTIDKFFGKSVNVSTPLKIRTQNSLVNNFPSDLESDCDDNLDISNIIKDIVDKRPDKRLCFIPTSIMSTIMHVDDSDVIAQSRKSSIAANNDKMKNISLDDSFDVLMRNGNDRLKYLDKLTCIGDSDNNQNRSGFFDAPTNDEKCDAFEIVLNISQGVLYENDDNDMDRFE